MASPEAVMRAAQMKPSMGGMGGEMPPAMEPKPPEAAPAQAPQAGLDQMVETLQGVGQFLQSQGPAGQRAMTHFTALLQEMATMGQQPQEAGSGRIPADQFPGVQVL